MNQADVKILTTRKQCLKRKFRRTFKREKKCCDNATAIKKEMRKINLNEPIYIGTSILNFSKVLLQDFQYNYIKNRNGKTKMLLMNTNSLMYKIEAKIVFEDFRKCKYFFDFSHYPIKIQNATIMQII